MRKNITLNLSLVLLMQSFAFSALSAQQISLSVKMALAPTSVDLGIDEDQRHVEYPTYIRNGALEYLFYSKYGNKEFWQIGWASKRIGEEEWVKKSSAPWGRYTPEISNSAFPVVIKKNSKFYLFFSAMSHGAKSYDQLKVSISSDLVYWETPITVFKAQQILSPEVIVQSKGIDVYFSALVHNKTQIIKVALGHNLETRLKPKVVFSVQSPSLSFYTINRFQYSKKDIWIIQFEHNWKLACLHKDGQIRTLQGPFFVANPNIQDLDRLFYGAEVVRVSNEYFEIYFNSIKDIGEEFGGVIKKVKFSAAELKSYDLRKCA